MRDSGPCHTMLVCWAETPWPAYRLSGIMPRNFESARPAMHYQVLQPNGREKRFLAIGTNGWGVSLASPSKSLLPPWQSFSWLSWIFFSFFLILSSSTYSSYIIKSSLFLTSTLPVCVAASSGMNRKKHPVLRRFRQWKLPRIGRNPLRSCLQKLSFIGLSDRLKSE